MEFQELSEFVRESIEDCIEQDCRLTKINDLNLSVPQSKLIKEAYSRLITLSNFFNGNSNTSDVSGRIGPQMSEIYAVKEAKAYSELLEYFFLDGASLFTVVASCILNPYYLILSVPIGVYVHHLFKKKSKKSKKITNHVDMLSRLGEPGLEEFIQIYSSEIKNILEIRY